jgi:hypothetical protein
MGDSGVLTSLLKTLFPQWLFIGVDACGRSGGLEIGINKRKVQMTNSYGFESGLRVEVLVVDLGQSFRILNIYGTY